MDVSDGCTGRREVHDDEVPWMRQRPSVDIRTEGCFGDGQAEATACMYARLQGMTGMQDTI